MFQNDFIHESYFAVIGLAGVGKSSFLNALSGIDDICKVNNGKFGTHNLQEVTFIDKDNNHKYFAIDTPGLDDSKYEEEKIMIINKIIKNFHKIKALLLIKKYNDVRIGKSFQEALKAYMNAFPVTNFWEHIIVINSFMNQYDDPDYEDFMKNEFQPFYEKILDEPNLVNFMKEKNIKLPSEIKEFFIESKRYKKIPQLKKEFDEIKNIIKNNQIMFKEIRISEVKEDIKRTNKGFYIAKKYNILTCIEFNGKTKEIEDIIEEREISTKDFELDHSELIKEYLEKDKVRWFDVATLGLSRMVRPTSKYKLYKVNYYKIGNKIIKDDKIYLGTINDE